MRSRSVWRLPQRSCAVGFPASKTSSKRWCPTPPALATSPVPYLEQDLAVDVFTVQKWCPSNLGTYVDKHLQRSVQCAGSYVLPLRHRCNGSVLLAVPTAHFIRCVADRQYWSRRIVVSTPATSNVILWPASRTSLPGITGWWKRCTVLILVCDVCGGGADWFEPRNATPAFSLSLDCEGFKRVTW